MTEQSHISEGHNASWLPTGLVLEGRWRIEGKLGRGGFATVYHGAHVQLERKAAIKVLDIQAPPEELAIFEERFLREAKFAARMEHPCIVQILDFGVTLQQGVRKPFLVMEKLSGHDLEHELLEHGPLEASRAERLFVQTLEALARCHEEGIVHRDLKPSNLFLSHPGTSHEKLVILDFGIARAFEDPDSKLTATSHFTGTPAYLAPEYISEQQVSPALDVYQMGLIIGEALTGQPVVQASAPLGYLMAHCNGQQRLHPELADTEVGRILKGALSVSPGARPPHAGALLSALRAASWADVPTSFSSDNTNHYALNVATEEGVNPWAHTQAATPSEEHLQPAFTQAPATQEATNLDNLHLTTDRTILKPVTHEQRSNPALLIFAGMVALGVLLGGGALLLQQLQPRSHEVTLERPTQTSSSSTTLEPPPAPTEVSAHPVEPALDKEEPPPPSQQTPTTSTTTPPAPTPLPTTSAPAITKPGPPSPAPARHVEQLDHLALTSADKKLEHAHDALSRGINAIPGTYLQFAVRIAEDGEEDAARSASFFLDVSDSYKSAQKSLDRSRRKAPPLSKLDRHSATLAAQLADLATLAAASYDYRLAGNAKDLGAFPGLIKRWDDLMKDFLSTYASWRQELFFEEERLFQAQVDALNQKKNPLQYHYFAALHDIADLMVELERTGDPTTLDAHLKRANKHIAYLKEIDLKSYEDRLDSTQRNALHATITALHRFPGHVATYQRAFAKHSKKDSHAARRQLASATQTFLTTYSFTMRKHYDRQGFE